MEGAGEPKPMLVHWIRKILLNRAARRIARVLGSRLRKDYGGGEYFTPVQIQTAFVKCGLPSRYLVIAYAAFLREEEFRIVVGKASKAEYTRLRAHFYRYYVDAKFSSSSMSAQPNPYVMQGGDSLPF